METPPAESQTDSHKATKWPSKTKRWKRHTHSKTNHNINKSSPLLLPCLDTQFVQSARRPPTHLHHISENPKNKPTTDETTRRTRQHETTEMGSKRKPNSQTPAGPTKDSTQHQTHPKPNPKQAPTPEPPQNPRPNPQVHKKSPVWQEVVIRQYLTKSLLLRLISINHVISFCKQTQSGSFDGVSRSDQSISCSSKQLNY